ncbi:MAG: hypothetical protein J6R88_05415 [Clostridia bacterium]|nr:hypothetical protein [Clostridia bacterium]
MDVISNNDLYVFSKRNENEVVDVNVNLYAVKAPIKKGDVVGEITVYKNGLEVAKSKLLANENADKMGYFDCIKELFEKWA